MQALEDLDYLAALDDAGNLSDLGVIMSEIPLPPELAKALLASCEFDCVDEMLTLAAMLTGRNRFSPRLLQPLQAFPALSGVLVLRRPALSPLLPYSAQKTSPNHLALLCLLSLFPVLVLAPNMHKSLCYY